MKTKSFASAAFLASLVLFTGCSKKIIAEDLCVTRTVEVGAFDAICVMSVVDVIYTQSSGRQKVEVIAPANLQEKIRVTTAGKVLKVDVKGQLTYIKKPRLEVRISAPAIKKATTHSTGDIVITNDIKTTGNLTLSTYSTGDITCKRLSCEQLKLSSHSTGDICTDNMQCNKLAIDTYSTGDINTGDVVCTELNIIAHSTGDIDLKKVQAEGTRAISHSTGNITVDQLNSRNLYCQASGTGNINIRQTNTTNLSAASHSTGDITLNGTCKTASLAAYNTGSIRCKGLSVDSLSATTHSVGHIKCHVNKYIYGRYSGIGDIDYTGNPSYVNIKKK